MADMNAAFEAMMANVTAPPLSLDEFRVFVSRDPNAKQALAFCEWYQRYREVYFDRTTVLSTRHTTAAGMRAEIPNVFALPQQTTRAAADRTSMRSVSVPNFRINEQQLETTANKIYTLKSHSFSMLSESMVDSAFNTASTGNSNSTGASRGQVSFSLSADQSAPTGSSVTTESFRCAQGARGYCNGSHASISRPKYYEQHTRSGESKPMRFTLSEISSRCASGDEAQKQEDYRLQLQSLLIHECWMRFLCSDSAKMPFVPNTELLYIKERLPLNLTRMLHPLLCNSDMLDALSSSASCVAPIDRSLSMPMAPDPSQRVVLATSRLISQRSLQFQPYEQLKRSLMTQIHIKRLNMLHKQQPSDSGLEYRDFCGLRLDPVKSDFLIGKADAESAPGVEAVTAK
ncbi:hypothetical protein LPJ56_004076, partial [Coemansia sp. RSA 2599]